MYSKIFVSALFSIVFALAAAAAPPPDSIDHATSGDLRMLTRFKIFLIVSISDKCPEE